ncbi:KdsC family phosphatase [Endozoicomonas lisbonensis]|uniref:3-deoxy-D-manno-octulosonate 8-phosphate phosphatase KdsC n=1 Tax=Endozoicomonas lisbonensis TaxID=3120522 RepID=A0ABV2SIV6_9GAMM
MSLSEANMPHVKPEAIKLAIFDIDGVLTDGTLLYGEHGELIKPFNAKDGVGIRLLQENGVAVAVITAKRSAPLARRMQDLKIEYFFPGCHDKAATFAQLKQTLNVQNDAVAYVGDDVLDLPVMEQVGLAIAPADGYQLVKEMAHIVTEASGGKGVVREVADLLIGARTDLAEAYRVLVMPKAAVVQ